MKTTPQALIDQYTRAGYWGQDTLADLFAQAVAEHPEQVALKDPPNRADLVGGEPKHYTYQALADCVDSVVQTFFDAGLRQDDKLVVQLPNTVEIVIVYLAAAKLGLIVSPVAMQYGSYELSPIFASIKPQAYIAPKEFLQQPFTAAKSELLNESCQVLLIDDQPSSDQEDDQSIKRLHLSEKISTAARTYLDSLTLDANDIFTICWTSGTTGRSKGVPRSHNHWLSSTLACRDAIGLADHSTILCPFPFINMAALGGFLYFWLQHRATMVLHHPFDPMVYLQQLQSEQVNYTIAPPAVLSKLLLQKDQIKVGFDLSHLKVIGSGSAPLAPDMVAGFEQEFGIEVMNIYGSNEGAAILSSVHDVLDPKSRAQFFPRFGRAEFSWDNRIAAQLQTKLIDLESGEEVESPGVPAELCFRGPTVFDGYFDSALDNQLVFTSDGFYRTGDLFAIAGDQQQYYQYVGRCKDLIVRGGVNISPEEVDQILESHSAVVEAACFGASDEVMGERIAAAVVLVPEQTLSLSDLADWFAEQGVAKFKWPEQLHVLEQLPRNAMNKIERRKLTASIEKDPQ